LRFVQATVTLNQNQTERVAMRKSKSRRSRRRIPSGQTGVEIILSPLGTQRWLGIPTKTAYTADSRRDFQDLYDLLVNSREQFYAWFEEATLIEAGAETKTGEFLERAADIKKDQKRYQQIIKQLPNVAEFSDEELEKRSGKASQLLGLAGEIMLMKTYFPRKIDSLRFLLEQRTQ
jgi:hypothetical protein